MQGDRSHSEHVLSGHHVLLINKPVSQVSYDLTEEYTEAQRR